MHAPLKIHKFLFMHSSLLYTSCLCSMYLNSDMVDIEKTDGICLLTFVVVDFSG